MKNKILTGLAILGFAFSVRATLPTYKTVGTNGLAAGPAAVIFPSDPNSQVRVVSLFYQSDSSSGQLQFTTGTTAFYSTTTNQTTTSVTNLINSTNGLAPNQVIVLEHGGVDYTNIVSTFNSSTNAGWSASYGGTNVVLTAAAGWGVIPSANDNIYVMGPTNTITVGAATNALEGEAIFVGNYGRPVMIRLTPAAVTNSLPAVSAHYDAVGN